MSGRLENLVEKAQAVDCGRYSLKCTEFLELAEWTRNNFIEGLSVMFGIGSMIRMENLHGIVYAIVEIM